MRGRIAARPGDGLEVRAIRLVFGAALALAVAACALREGPATTLEPLAPEPSPAPAEPAPEAPKPADPKPEADPPRATKPPEAPPPVEPERSAVTLPEKAFTMGCSPGPERRCDADEPRRRVRVPAFRLDRFEVSVGDFRACVGAGACRAAGADAPRLDGREERDWAWTCNWSPKPRGRERHPMNCVTWPQAADYCRWVGAALPSEEAWERAAGGAEGHIYPWGDEFGSDPVRANVADSSLAERVPGLGDEALDDGHASTAPVGSYPAGDSPEGIHDLAGNVWEWTASWYDAGETRRVIRGGSWLGGASHARAANRSGFRPGDSAGDLGFRCASED